MVITKKGHSFRKFTICMGTRVDGLWNGLEMIACSVSEKTWLQCFCIQLFLLKYK